MQPPLDLTDAEHTFWQPWSQRFVRVVDEIRSVDDSDASDNVKRARLEQLAADIDALRQQLRLRPNPSGSFSAVIDAFREPLDSEPIHLAEALERLQALSALTPNSQTEPPATRRRSVRTHMRVVGDQPELPGLEPTNQGATR